MVANFSVLTGSDRALEGYSKKKVPYQELGPSYSQIQQREKRKRRKRTSKLSMSTKPRLWTHKEKFKEERPAGKDPPKGGLPILRVIL